MSLQHELSACIILLFTNAVASDLCPSGYLHLHPPELMVEYGGLFEMSCSTSQKNSTLKWNITPELYFEGSMVNNSLNLRIESLQEWDIEANCTLSQTDYQCNGSPSLIIYKVPGNVTITLVNHTEVDGDGTPYELLCDVYDIAPVQHLTVRWYRQNITVNESQFTDIEIGPRNVSASLTIFPTREDNGIQYWCEAELGLKQHGPEPPLKVPSDPLYIIIKKAMPTIPTSAMTTTLTASAGTPGVPTPTLPPNSIDIVAVSPGPMADGKKYTLSCHIKIPENEMSAGNGTVKWFIGQNLLNTETIDITLEAPQINVTFLYEALIAHDGEQYQCAVEFQRPGEDSPTELKSDIVNILVYTGCPAAISPSSLVVKYGERALATCRALTSIHGMGWESTVGVVALEAGVTELNWTVKELRKWTVKPQCFINPLDGDQCSTELHVVVYMTPESLPITINRQGPLAVGNYYKLYCHIENIAPVENLTVRWFKGETLLSTDSSFKSFSVGPQNVTSENLITVNESDNGTQYRCEAELDLGPGGPPALTSDPLPITVYSGCPIVLRPSTLVVKYGDSASADCSTFLPHNGIGWNSTLNPVGRMKGVKNITWRVDNLTEWTVEPKCVIDTDEGQCGTALTVIVYKFPSTINLAGYTAEMVEGQNYTLTCHIQDVTPVEKLTVNWFKEETLLTEHHQLVIVDNQTVTSHLHIKPSTSDNGARYRCEAKLQLGPISPPPITSEYVITVKGNWTPTIVTICIIIILFLLALAFLIWYIKRRRGNYSVVQTDIPLTGTANGRAL